MGVATTRILAAAMLFAAVTTVPAGPSRTEGASRPPATAGRFYPADAEGLRLAVRLFLRDAISPGKERPVALVSPHAGFLYSGQIAADAWRQVSAHDYDVVVVLGPNHTVPPFDGVALWDGDAFLTPLGPVEIDREMVAALLVSDEAFVQRAEAHDREHSIEVQLPFLQVALPGVKIVPGVVGGGGAELLARLGHKLAAALRNRKPLIVASSDLSHYPAYDDAVESDRDVLDAVATLDPAAFRLAIANEARRGREGLSTCACGEHPIALAMTAAKELGAERGRIVSYANSGDSVLADRSRVVGYGAVAFVPGADSTGTGSEQHPGRDRDPTPGAPLPPIGDAERSELLAWARDTIDRFQHTGTAPLARSLSPGCRRKQGVFVTLEKNGELRGCIGHMADDLPVGQAVGAMALQAAFNDRRFEPLEPGELDEVSIEISLLTPMTAVPDPSSIVVGRDGVRLEKSGRAGVFLPKVAVENGWSRDEMLEHLCRKAGLPGGCWRSDARLLTFRAEVFRERERPGEPSR